MQLKIDRQLLYTSTHKILSSTIIHVNVSSEFMNIGGNRSDHFGENKMRQNEKENYIPIIIKSDYISLFHS